MFVKAPYRGSQYNTAKLLLNEAIGWTNQTGITDIYLGTTEKFLAAHRFYPKHGFTQISSKDLPENFPIMIVDTIFFHQRPAAISHR
jgi:GNAT superfamily N-acetyltransferase